MGHADGIDAVLVDLTSKGEEPWIRFSPFYPHGDIPIPMGNGATAHSVEGVICQWEVA